MMRCAMLNCVTLSCDALCCVGKKWRVLRAFVFMMHKGMESMMENCTQTMATKLILVVVVNLKWFKLKLGLGSQLDKTRQRFTLKIH
jgi:hypothetical protein